MKTWIKPQFQEVCMNAEIGSYQSDAAPERSRKLGAVLPFQRRAANAGQGPDTPPEPDLAA